MWTLGCSHRTRSPVVPHAAPAGPQGQGRPEPGHDGQDCVRLKSSRPCVSTAGAAPACHAGCQRARLPAADLASGPDVLSAEEPCHVGGVGVQGCPGLGVQRGERCEHDLAARDVPGRHGPAAGQRERPEQPVDRDDPPVRADDRSPGTPSRAAADRTRPAAVAAAARPPRAAGWPAARPGRPLAASRRTGPGRAGHREARCPPTGRGRGPLPGHARRGNAGPVHRAPPRGSSPAAVRPASPGPARTPGLVRPPGRARSGPGCWPAPGCAPSPGLRSAPRQRRPARGAETGSAGRRRPAPPARRPPPAPRLPAARPPAPAGGSSRSAAAGWSADAATSSPRRGPGARCRGSAR